MTPIKQLERLRKIKAICNELEMSIIEIIPDVERMTRQEQLNKILINVSISFRLEPEQITGNSRRKKNCVARLMFYHIARLFSFRFVKIAEKVNRHHSTVVTNVGNYPLNKMIFYYPDYRGKINKSLDSFGIKKDHIDQ